MKVLAISGSLSGSKTYTAVKKAAQFLEEATNADVEVINLADYDLQFCDGRDPLSYGGDTKAVIEKVINADAFIIGTPIYRGSLTGALKNVFDLIPNDSLKGKAIGFIATGGTYHHYLAIEHQLHPLASYFRSPVVPGGVYAHNDHFTNGEITDQDILRRLKDLAESLVLLSHTFRERYGIEQPVIPRRN
ncbi:NADPH-dependent FMN reductase [Mesobacillus harenae]|uniref:NADPH-dependent FMN reductase n=1 Tax=Mesobacillus harenae TaxID=2213203 RepID=UPI0015812653|nr:NAD(P)H-dependent oxidoreductase [Mesobacillus harenae]